MKLNNIAIIGMGTSITSCINEKIKESEKDIIVLKEEPETRMEITNPFKDLNTLYSPYQEKRTKKYRKCNNAKRPKPRKKRK